MHSPRPKLRRPLTCKEKGKKKMPEYGTEKEESDRSISNTGENEDRPSKTKSESAKKALKSANEKLRRSTHQKHPVVRYGYNEYMGHHYAYMTKVAGVRELETYVEAAKDANCRHLMPTTHGTWLTLPDTTNRSAANGCIR